jgi:hypothetical protein
LKKQLAELDSQISQIKNETTLEEAKLKEKEQDLRISELKIKEVRR